MTGRRDMDMFLGEMFFSVFVVDVVHKYSK